jgi:SepF-like predicted cell division protein (DUF552 family)
MAKNWRTRGNGAIYSGQAHLASCVNVISSDSDRCIDAKSTAKLIIQCVNGWDDLVAEKEQLVEIKDLLVEQVNNITKQRDELLEVAKEIRSHFKKQGGFWLVADSKKDPTASLDKLEAVIKNCKKG